MDDAVLPGDLPASAGQHTSFAMRHWLAATAFALFLAACGGEHHDPADHGDHAGAADRHETTGEVTEVGDGTITIRHEEVPGVMRAMTMPFAVEDASLVEGVEAGQRVTFEFEETADGRYVLRSLTRSE
jgi:Cu/Ag efflux protein CusF